MLDRERAELFRQYAGQMLAAIISTSSGAEAMPRPDKAAKQACVMAGTLLQEVEKAESKLEK